MNIDLSIILSAGGMIVVAAVGWGKLVSAESRQKEENLNIWNEISKCRKWQEEHAKDSNEKRIEFLQDLSKLRETMASKEGKLDEILGRLDKIEIKIDKIEVSKN